MREGVHNLLWQVLGSVILAGLFSALLRKMVEQYISAPRAMILFASIVVILTTLLIARSNWDRWESLPDVPQLPVKPIADTDLNKKEEPRLILSIQTVIMPDKIGSSAIWIVDDRGGKPKGTPAMAIFVKVSNLGDKPLSVSSYSLEEHEGDKWITIPTLDTRQQSVYFIGPGRISSAIGLDLSKFRLDSNLEKAIPPEGSVSGWIFFPRVVTLENARFGVVDALGRSVSASTSRNLQVRIENKEHPALLSVNKTTRDLTSVVQQWKSK